ncbi:hypothetical protein Srut_20850 [Streptomyces rutgersensis]|nr:hypothetical protein Srut_20850 [Streptomyces rutgersensis]
MSRLRVLQEGVKQEAAKSACRRRGRPEVRPPVNLTASCAGAPPGEGLLRTMTGAAGRPAGDARVGLGARRALPVRGPTAPGLRPLYRTGGTGGAAPPARTVEGRGRSAGGRPGCLPATPAQGLKRRCPSGGAVLRRRASKAFLVRCRPPGRGHGGVPAPPRSQAGRAVAAAAPPVSPHLPQPSKKSHVGRIVHSLE